MKLLQSLQELSLGSSAVDLKNSDATDAGRSDVSDKAAASSDIKFSLMRNTINSDGKVSGSGVADYLERAAELNDEVDTVPFGLETDDGQIVKVYVNAAEADKFAEALKNLLGIEDDIEEAINRLSTQFDIVDVVWPTKTGDDLTDTENDTEKYLAVDDKSMAEDEEENEPTETGEASGDDAPTDSPNTVELTVPEKAKIQDEDIRDFLNTQVIVKLGDFTRDGNTLKIQPAGKNEISDELVQDLQTAFENYLTDKGLFQEAKLSLLQGITANLVQEDKWLKKTTEVGYYVEGPDGKCLGPMEEYKARQKIKELGGDENGYTLTYMSDYDVSRMDEDLNIADDYGHAVVSLAIALGIPEVILAAKQSVLTQSLRTTKQSLKNRAQVMAAIGRVMTAITSQQPKVTEPTQPSTGTKTNVPGV